jgi:hypothetical protein
MVLCEVWHDCPVTLPKRTLRLNWKGLNVTCRARALQNDVKDSNLPK